MNPTEQPNTDSLSAAERVDGGGLLSWLLRAVPTAGVLALLAGIGYWGHRTEWTFAARPAPPQKTTDWCNLHGFAKSECVECNPELLPKPPSFGWCSRHGVYDCPLEHPQVAQTTKPVRVTAADLERADRALRLRMRPENDPDCARRFRRIQFESAEAVVKVGIDIAPVFDSGITEAVVASGETGYDQTAYARLSARAAGIAVRVSKKNGDTVQRGDLLAVVDAAQVGKTKAEFLEAMLQVRQRRRVLDDLKGVAATLPTQVREAEASLREAEIRMQSTEQILSNLALPVRAADFEKLTPEQAGRAIRLAGLPKAAIEDLDPKTASANLLPLLAPQDGIVLECGVVAGETVAAGKVLFVVADVGRMWLTLHVSPQDARLLTAGLPVRFKPDGSNDEYPGRLIWVGAQADEKTRTVPVRAELANDKGHVRSGTFGIGRVVLRDEPSAITVPNEAVHFDGRCHLVFVRDKDYLKAGAPKVFHPRMVRIGAKDDKNTEIIAGVLANEVVAAKGSSVLLKELRRNVPK